MNLSPNHWRPPSRAKRLRQSLLLLLACLAVGAVTGCHTLKFYGQAIKGQYQLFAHQQPIQQLLADPATPAKLKDRLQLLQQLRAFAHHELALPVDGHYLKYVDVHRDFVTWNVEAAPEFSMQSKTWWYPLVGSLKYRGYFSKAGATNYAAVLRKKGLDTYVGGVPAYSTLGWFHDPVINTFLFESEPDLAETLFHELGHQRVFARGDTDFNEAFATTVGETGARRWLKAKADPAALQNYEAELQRTRQFVHLTMQTAARLETLYGDQRNDEGKIQAHPKNRRLSPEQLRAQKQQILDQLEHDYAQLKTQWHGANDYDLWFSRGVNNAKLNSVATYYELVPGFEQLLAINGGNLEKFYQAVEQLSKRSKKERHQQLKALARQLIAARSPPQP